MSYRLDRVAGLCLLVLAASTPAWSQTSQAKTEQGFAKIGTYVGAGGLLNFALDDGNFDGLSRYKSDTSEEFGILPSLQKQSLTRLMVGFRIRPGALEVSYERASLGGTFLGASAPTSFNAFNVDWRFFFLTRSRVQPHLLAGAAMPFVIIEDGSVLDNKYGNAKYTGYGLNIEPGATVFLTPRVGVSVGYQVRVMLFRHAKGVSGTQYNLRPTFRETSNNAIVMAFYTF